MMKVYTAEQDLAPLINASNSIAYQQEVFSFDRDLSIEQKIKAGLRDFLDNPDLQLNYSVFGGERDSDLHYVQSILVTTNWNKNDDVFDNHEVWVARNTPQHKPTNLGHDEHEIVGHMTANWVIDEDGKLLDDNTHVDDLPELFHVVNGSVIYKAWQDEKLVERANKLIEEINAGQKFVSMECMFAGFDYAVISPEKTYKVIARNEETAFLTKHLRAYGGNGLYDGYKVGRLLRNIVFTGKGFVDKPANPNSIIFDKEKIFNFSEAEYIESADFNKSGVYIKLDNIITSEENSMTVDVYKEQVTDLKAQIDTLNKQLAEAHERLTKVDVQKLEATIEELNTQIIDSKAELNSANEIVTNLSEQLKQKDSELEALTESNEKFKVEFEAIKANELRTNRISILVDGGVDKEVAEKKVDLYSNLSDEQFTDLANDIIAFTKSHKDDNVDMSEEEVEVSESEETDIPTEEQDDAEADTEVLDNVESNSEVDLAAEVDDPSNDKFHVLSHALAKLLGQNDDDNSEEEK